MTTTRKRAEAWLWEHWLRKDYPGNDLLLACIMQQDSTKETLRHFDAQSEHYRGMLSGDDDTQLDKDSFGFDYSDGFVLTTLVECHEGPHTDDCPHRIPWRERDAAAAEDNEDAGHPTGVSERDFTGGDVR